MSKLSRKAKVSSVLLGLTCAVLCAASHGFAQDDHWRTLNTRVQNLVNQQRYAEALPIAEASLRDAERDFGPSDPRVAVSLENLAFLRADQNDYAGAEQLAQRALTIVQTAPSPNLRSVGEA